MVARKRAKPSDAERTNRDVATLDEMQKVIAGEATPDNDKSAPANTLRTALPAGSTKNPALAPVVPVFHPTRRGPKEPPAAYREEEVVAVGPGYYDNRRIRPGEVFTMAFAGDGYLPSWVRLANKEDKDPEVSRSRQVQTGSTGQEIRDDVLEDAGTVVPTYLGGNQRLPSQMHS
jgi:hypothetical protein